MHHNWMMLLGNARKITIDLLNVCYIGVGITKINTTQLQAIMQKHMLIKILKLFDVAEIACLSTIYGQTRM